MEHSTVFLFIFFHELDIFNVTIAIHLLGECEY